jgi:endonuclease/exonuclease/phosphatase family metal-dependent hydrolase
MTRAHWGWLVIGWLGCTTFAIAADELATDLRVMSFNIRYGTAKDGENRWELRKEFLAGTIREFRPDLLGTQETLKTQRDFLASRLPDHEVLGVGRDNGKDQGEMTALYYRRDRFEVLDSGHFWLSETPDVPGSKSWDSSLPRMVSWVRLRDRKQPAAPPIVFANTHFDHLGTVARLESAQMLRRRAEERQSDDSLILTGDFNASENSDPYRAVFGPHVNQPSPLVDTFRSVHPERGPREGTFSGFKVTETNGGRIDWIGVSRDWTVLSAGIDRTARDDRTPSDHFPVTAVLRRAIPK